MDMKIIAIILVITFLIFFITFPLIVLILTPLGGSEEFEDGDVVQNKSNSRVLVQVIDMKGDAPFFTGVFIEPNNHYGFEELYFLKRDFKKKGK